MTMPINKLNGLGPKAEQYLNEIGILNSSDLERVGPVPAFLALQKHGRINPSLNFLYAMVGALENRHWLEIAKTEKDRLLLELDALEQQEKLENTEINSK